ncbi:hypothetical protein HLH34_04500 [Gluconacetobacter azotocaptans]|uniref:Uncharacterized protein n=1 Tax=Gluconacetobacter azotocaptans TaxID=142834 RepID=A0A7W4PE94_9PROT|nr:hypothetical protein [Gluconacetobacter azotocaptans]MBB2189224.1 hypothetical protein [Gluconacetobacter azotocaptans]GBQ32315.1 hypothetical protein AA13594_2333 [Gluconacetobacter azotocaptans DSM 13594]
MNRIQCGVLAAVLCLVPSLVRAQSQIVPLLPGQLLSAAILSTIQSGKADYSGLVAEVARASAAEGTLQSSTVANMDGSSTNQLLSTPVVSGGRLDGAQSIPGFANDAAARTIAQHFVDLPNVLDFGAVAGTADSGNGFLSAYETAPATTGFRVLNFPYSASGYTANALSGASNDYLYPGVGSLKNELPGIYYLNGNVVAGTMGGTPENGHGTFNSEITNPWNVVTNIREVLDPAAVPSRGAGVTYVGHSVECLPQRPNASDANTTIRGIACLYFGGDTGTGGATGTAYGSEIVNMVQNVDTNSGNILELNQNWNGQVADGGFSRTLYITGGGNYPNPNSAAIEINHGTYSGGSAPYGSGIVIRGSTNDLAMFRASATDPGYFQLGLNENAAYIYSLDKQANLWATSLATHNAAGTTTSAIDTNGYSTAAGYTASNGIAVNGGQIVIGNTASIAGNTSLTWAVISALIGVPESSMLWCHDCRAPGQAAGAGTGRWIYADSAGHWLDQATGTTPTN